MDEPQTITLASGEIVVAGQIVQYAGQECKVSKNGALYGLTDKRFVSPPAPAFALTPISSSEQGRDIASIRWHAPRQAAAIAAVREAAGNDSLDTIELADGYLVQAMISEVVLDNSGKTRGADRVKAWESVLEHSGMSGKQPKQAQQQAEPGRVLDVDALQAVVAALAQAKALQQGADVDTE
jgi:hypothetical protein